MARLGWTTPQYDFRWQSRPGLTGLAQLACLRSSGDALELDRAYLAGRSLVLDAQLIALSFVVNAVGKAPVRSLLDRRRLVGDARRHIASVERREV